MHALVLVPVATVAKCRVCDMNEHLLHTDDWAVRGAVETAWSRQVVHCTAAWLCLQLETLPPCLPVCCSYNLDNSDNARAAHYLNQQQGEPLRQCLQLLHNAPQSTAAHGRVMVVVWQRYAARREYQGRCMVVSWPPYCGSSTT
jgi:hypothetical protein